MNRSLDVGQCIKKNLQSSSNPASDSTLYDLYGVVNHTGGLLGGHYTAYARTPHASAREKNKLGKSVYSAYSLN